MPISEWNREHTIYVLRAAQAGSSVGDINREARFSYWGSMQVTFVLREQGYIRETIVGMRAVTPYVMQGGFQVADEPIWRGEITEKGEALLREFGGNGVSERAVCGFCGQRMESGVGCTARTYDDYADGISRERIPYCAPHDLLSPGERCHDCWVAPGQFHHPGCDAEACPRCFGQLISCGCPTRTYL